MNIKQSNKIVTNRKSPKNEIDYINAYKKVMSNANKKDDYDISAVTTLNGEKGHAMMKQSINRAKDNNNHIGKNYVSDTELKKVMKNKKR